VARRIFFDTEFTSLTDDARLISIGFIDESGQHTFYAEVLGIEAADCSEFCRAHVLPELERGGVALSLSQLRADLSDWLSERGPARLVCDSARDAVQLARLFPTGAPGSCEVTVLSFWGNLRRRVLNGGRRLHRTHGLRVHHALDDARVNRIALI
jgi:hypothetical protein